MPEELSIPTALTIGHSNHPIDAFIGLVKRHGVQCVADVRSYPGSRWAPQFGGKLLRASLADQEIDYLWLGQALGGRRDDPKVVCCRVKMLLLFSREK